MVLAPQKYPWSGYRYKAGLVEQEWIDLDPVYLGLGADKKQRIQRYRKFESLVVTAAMVVS